MIDIPSPFPSYTSYNAKTLLQHVDVLKAAIQELQAEVAALKAAAQQTEKKKPTTKD